MEGWRDRESNRWYYDDLFNSYRVQNDDNDDLQCYLSFSSLLSLLRGLVIFSIV